MQFPSMQGMHRRHVSTECDEIEIWKKNRLAYQDRKLPKMCNLDIDAGRHNEAHDSALFQKAKWSMWGQKAVEGWGIVTSLMNFSLKIK